MNQLEKLFAEKRTENGDKSYNTTGNNLIDLLFMADYFTNNLGEVHIGTSEKEKLFSMYMRDPRHGQGRRDLGRHLMMHSNLSPQMIVKAGRFDDLWHIPNKENIEFLLHNLRLSDSLARKWMPRLTGKDKRIAKALCKEWGISEREYRALIKEKNTTEYKLSYAELNTNNTTLDALFNKENYVHPLVDKIDFEKVPSLAMTKYIRAFSTRPDIKERFGEYIVAVKEEKKKVNTSTANVHNAYKMVKNNEYRQSNVEEATEVIGAKIVEQETNNLSFNCICVLDTSGSMGYYLNPSSLCSKAISVAHAIATNSTYAKNQVISFSDYPQLMTIKGKTLNEQYKSMYTGDCSNTDLGAVFKILMGLKEFPEYVIVMSDMEFDEGSSFNYKQWYNMVKKNNAKTKLIWWNFNNRNRTTPEIDEYGNIYMSGFDLQALLLVPEVMDMDTYIDNILENYKKKIDLA